MRDCKHGIDKRYCAYCNKVRILPNTSVRVYDMVDQMNLLEGQINKGIPYDRRYYNVKRYY